MLLVVFFLPYIFLLLTCFYFSPRLLWLCILYVYFLFVVVVVVLYNLYLRMIKEAHVILCIINAHFGNTYFCCLYRQKETKLGVFFCINFFFVCVYANYISKSTQFLARPTKTQTTPSSWYDRQWRRRAAIICCYGMKSNKRLTVAEQVSL